MAQKFFLQNRDGTQEIPVPEDGSEVLHVMMAVWLAKDGDPAMLSAFLTERGGKVYGHTNSRCGEVVDLSG